ncbi:MAG: DUF2764 domain-containing protein [Tannerella sp.]|jgi:hypothetical protein|nr:DUF2764 domain-containing protein [Tannerella sp.]
MSAYHYLISGLPDIAIDDRMPPYSTMEFKDILSEYLTKTDTYLFELLLLEIDNKNLLEQIKHPDYDLLDGGKFTFEELDVLITGVQADLDRTKDHNVYIDGVYDAYDDSQFKIKRFKNRIKNKYMPAYFEQFVRMYLEEAKFEDEISISWEDRLSAMYYDFAVKSANEFVASWSELNLNIKNIFTAITCRKYNLNREKYIVGHTETSNQLRLSAACDFDLSETLGDLVPALMGIAEERDFLQREWKTDLLKWEWLDDRIFTKVFEIDYILAYLLKLQMLEYWSNLDKHKGEEAFRQLMGTISMSSHHSLEEFILMTAQKQ